MEIFIGIEALFFGHTGDKTVMIDRSFTNLSDFRLVFCCRADPMCSAPRSPIRFPSRLEVRVYIGYVND